MRLINWFVPALILLITLRITTLYHLRMLNVHEYWVWKHL